MAPLTRKHGAEPGDLIEIFRVGYQHWGVYVGGNKIVHLTFISDDKMASAQAMVDGTAEVKWENIWDVIGNSDFRVNNQLDDKYESRTPKTIVRKALGMVGEKLQYSVINFNCEHFATDLRYGKAESRQVKRRPVAAVLASVFKGLIPTSVSTSIGSSATATSSRVVSAWPKVSTRPGKQNQFF